MIVDIATLSFQNCNQKWHVRENDQDFICLKLSELGFINLMIILSTNRYFATMQTKADSIYVAWVSKAALALLALNLLLQTPAHTGTNQ